MYEKVLIKNKEIKISDKISNKNYTNDTLISLLLSNLKKFNDLDEKVIYNFKEGLNELKLINQGKLKARPIKEFLDEL